MLSVNGKTLKSKSARKSLMYCCCFLLFAPCNNSIYDWIDKQRTPAFSIFPAALLFPRCTHIRISVSNIMNPCFPDPVHFIEHRSFPAPVYTKQGMVFYPGAGSSGYRSQPALYLAAI